jgi:hypothetical protein
MTVLRIATFNVENLFSRPVALSFEDWDEGKPILEDHARFNLIVGKPSYSAADKAELLAIMNRWGLTSAHASSPFFLLRDIRVTSPATLATKRSRSRRMPGPTGSAGWICSGLRLTQLPSATRHESLPRSILTSCCWLRSRIA